jgi:hypothetical protein
MMQSIIYVTDPVEQSTLREGPLCQAFLATAGQVELVLFRKLQYLSVCARARVACNTEKSGSAPVSITVVRWLRLGRVVLRSTRRSASSVLTEIRAKRVSGSMREIAIKRPKMSRPVGSRTGAVAGMCYRFCQTWWSELQN